MSTKQTFTQLKKSLNAEQLNELLAVETFPDLKVFLNNRIDNRFVVPLEDKDVPEQFQSYIPRYRVLANRLGWNGVIAYRVRAGFYFTDGAKLGPCHEDWKYLQDWKIKEGDESTQSAIVFWIPRILEGSLNKDVSQQKKLLTELRTELQLPDHHLTNFGNISLLTALIFYHYKHTGECVPLDKYIIRTDTVGVGGVRVSLQWIGGGLDCGCWSLVDGRDGVLGCFALGVEALES